MTRKYNWKTGCEVEATLSVIGGRWKPILICRLLRGRKRFSELCRLAPNATERMITLHLRELEADGIVSRHVFAEIPPRVEYEVTEFGRTLEPIIRAMQTWGGAFKASRLEEEAEPDNASQATRRADRAAAALMAVSSTAPDDDGSSGGARAWRQSGVVDDGLGHP